MKILLTLTFLIIFNFGNGQSIITISPVEVGLLYNRNLKQVNTDTVLSYGNYKILPSDSVIVFDIKQKAIELEFEALTNDELLILIKTQLIYQPDLNEIPRLFNLIGHGFEDSFIVPELKASTRSIIKNFNSVDLYRKDKSELKLQILDSLNNVEYSKLLNYQNLKINITEYPHIFKEAEKAGLLNQYHNLKSNVKNNRKAALNELFNNGSRTAYLMILTHWTNENDQEVLDFILERLAKD